MISPYTHLNPFMTLSIDLRLLISGAEGTRLGSCIYLISCRYGRIPTLASVLLSLGSPKVDV